MSDESPTRAESEEPFSSPPPTAHEAPSTSSPSLHEPPQHPMPPPHHGHMHQNVIYVLTATPEGEYYYAVLPVPPGTRSYAPFPSYSGYSYGGGPPHDALYDGNYGSAAPPPQPPGPGADLSPPPASPDGHPSQDIATADGAPYPSPFPRLHDHDHDHEDYATPGAESLPSSHVLGSSPCDRPVVGPSASRWARRGCEGEAPAWMWVQYQL